MSREEIYMICRFLNAYNTRQTAQTRPRCTLQSFRISNQFCKLEDLMTFMIYISGCERLLFSGWKLVNFSKCIKQHQDCFLLKIDCVEKSVIYFSIFYFLLVCLFWRSDVRCLLQVKIPIIFNASSSNFLKITFSRKFI